ncbi:MAG: TetR/AcrR family transcriptional regulator [Rhodospirillaceae bacterium]|nr:MAG: TetR/AcrR family transcriptional regulator [Rhodospirillaceae bacterium]
MAQRPKTRTGSKTKTRSKTRTGSAGSGRASGARSARRKTAHAAEATGGQQTSDIRSRLHDALMSQLATIGWRDLSYADIVDSAGLSLATAYRVYRSKIGVLGGFVSEIDQQLLVTLEADPLDGNTRDKLFDLIMRRLDLQQGNKPAIDGLLRDLTRSPGEALCIADRLGRSMSLMLEMAGVSTSGLRGFVRTQALTGLYMHVLRTWLKDESEDAAKTMALLDKRLDQAERLLGLMKHRSRDK